MPTASDQTTSSARRYEDNIFRVLSSAKTTNNLNPEQIVLPANTLLTLTSADVIITQAPGSITALGLATIMFPVGCSSCVAGPPPFFFMSIDGGPPLLITPAVAGTPWGDNSPLSEGTLKVHGVKTFLGLAPGPHTVTLLANYIPAGPPLSGVPTIEQFNATLNLVSSL